MTISAIGDNRKQIALIIHALPIKSMELMMVNCRALAGLIIPLGISRMEVLGFFASNVLSR